MKSMQTIDDFNFHLLCQINLFCVTRWENGRMNNLLHSFIQIFQSQ